MVPKIGFEPTSYFQLPLAPFVAERDTWALNLELRVRIELTTSGWKPDTLPLRQRSTNLFIPKTEQSPLLCITVCSLGLHEGFLGSPHLYSMQTNRSILATRTGLEPVASSVTG